MYETEASRGTRDSRERDKAWMGRKKSASRQTRLTHLLEYYANDYYRMQV